MLQRSSSAFEFLLWGEPVQARPPFVGKSTMPQGRPRSSMIKGNKVDPLSTQHRHYLLTNHDQISADVVEPSVNVRS
ncbi:hypothetical protein M405DRAFT_156867 [Rhizopogon salebrosus TDB-379]|nr:hypothetical protein M405DRAFT_156867 [Rhizopogon salebrosus TDB-379]